jgi:uridine kinase
MSASSATFTIRFYFPGLGEISLVYHFRSLCLGKDITGAVSNQVKIRLTALVSMMNGVIRLMIIGIAGGSGAGKTTVARSIAEKLGKENVAYLSQDWYYLDHSHLTPQQRSKLNMDHPNAFDSQLLISHLNQMRQGLPINIPSYDFGTYARSTHTNPMAPQAVAVLEGILVLAIPELRSVLDFKIFVDADPDIRLIRRLERDIKDRGSTFDDTIKRYLSTVRPMHEAFVEPSKRYADIIVPRGGQNDVATNLLVDLVEHYTIHKFNGYLATP